MGGRRISNILTQYDGEIVRVWYREDPKHNKVPQKLVGPYKRISNNQIIMEVAGKVRTLKLKDITNVKPVHNGNNKKREEQNYTKRS